MRTPNEALRALARDYLQFRRQFAHERQHARRVERQRRWFGQLLGALGYEHAPHNHVLDDGDEVPVLFAGRQHGSVSLLVLGACDAAGEDEDPLALKPHPAQFHREAPPPDGILRESWGDVVTRRIYGQPHPPRWVILLSAGQVLLIERGKWTHNRLLRFVLDDVLGRREDHTFKATAALLHRECLLPEQGAILLDSLDDNSHKHAFAVSFERTDSHLLRRQVIRVMSDWTCHHWISDKIGNFNTYTEWERRALLIGSYCLGDEGRHWRKYIKKTLSPTEKTIRHWAAMRREQERSIPV